MAERSGLRTREDRQQARRVEQLSAEVLADMAKYAKTGEDLDWTKIDDARERTRVRNRLRNRKRYGFSGRRYVHSGSMAQIQQQQGTNVQSAGLEHNPHSIEHTDGEEAESSSDTSDATSRDSSPDVPIQLSLLEAREYLRALYGKLRHHGEPGGWALLASYYYTLGHFVWSYYDDKTRAMWTEMFEEASRAPETPLEVSRALEEALKELLKVKAVDLNLIDYDMELPAEGAGIVYGLADDDDLFDLMASGAIFTGGYSQPTLLAKTRRTLQYSNADYNSKIELVSAAMLIWPNEQFETESTVLANFIEAYRAYLDGLRTGIAKDKPRKKLPGSTSGPASSPATEGSNSSAPPTTALSALKIRMAAMNKLNDELKAVAISSTSEALRSNIATISKLQDELKAAQAPPQSSSVS